jgi:lysophospholipase L1-like esterase
MARIALVGDSHAQVLWPVLRPSLTAQGHEVVLSLANPGWSEAKYLTTDIGGQLRSAAPDIVVFELGGNNQKMSEGAYVPDLQRLVAFAKDAGAKTVIWFSPFHATTGDTARRHEASSEMQSRVLPSMGVRWVDTRPYSKTGHRSDGVHFSNEGYRQLAARMLPEIRETGMAQSGWVLPVALGMAVVAVAVALRVRLSR